MTDPTTCRHQHIERTRVADEATAIDICQRCQAYRILRLEQPWVGEQEGWRKRGGERLP